MLTCTKRYDDFPFAHRAHNHDGHCKYIHGHNWAFEIQFSASEVDENGFVFDFGKLKDLRHTFCELFDHTFLMNHADPMLQDFKEFTELMGISNIIEVQDCSCEGIAKLVWQLSNSYAVKTTDGRCRVRRVVVYEDSKNSATYAPVALS